MILIDNLILPYKKTMNFLDKFLVWTGKTKASHPHLIQILYLYLVKIVCYLIFFNMCLIWSFILFREKTKTYLEKYMNYFNFEPKAYVCIRLLVLALSLETIDSAKQKIS